MTENVFNREIHNAEAMRESGNRPDYWTGYMYGIRCQYHGNIFSDPKDRADCEARKDDLGEGYRDGISFKDGRGGNHGGGRKSEGKSANIAIRCTPEQLETIKQNARDAGMTMSEYICKRCAE